MKGFHFIFTFVSFVSSAQINYPKQIDSLKFIADMPYLCASGFGTGCGDRLFWNVVTLKDKAIPLLINKLDDSTLSRAVVPFFGDYYAVADIAYDALREIIQSLPTYDFIDVQTERDCGYCVYWSYVRQDIHNRKKFKKAVQQWYAQNKNKLIWVTNNSQFMCGEMRFPHPNGGHYELPKEH